MSATEKLREMLDESGVEYYESPNGVAWGKLAMPIHGRMYTHYAVELDGLLCVDSHCITPEQAIEATLGAAKEPPTAVKVTLPSEWNACEPIPWVDVTVPNGDVTHLVPEATLGRGECHDKGNIEQFICSECGCHLDMQDDDCEATMWLDGEAMAPRFCPNCGKRVKDVK